MSSKTYNNKRGPRPANKPEKIFSEDETVEPTVHKKKSSHRSPAMRRRANERMDRQRAKLGEAHDAREKKRIYDELMFGFRSEAEIMKALQVVTVPKSVIMPVTFRSTGFMCQFMFCKFAQLRIRMPSCTVYQLFRVTLFQLEARIDACGREHCSRNRGDDEIYVTTKITVEQLRAVSTLGANLAPFANMIKNLGLIKGFGTTYIPRIAKIPYVCGAPVAEPTHVYYSSLRSIVTRLSSGQTDWDERVYFYEHNPLPGARWQGDKARYRAYKTGGIAPEDAVDADGDQIIDPPARRVPASQSFPLLANPSDFWPHDYDVERLVDDVGRVSSLLEVIGRKYPKYVHCGAIDYRSPGSVSSLVCNELGTLRCRDLDLQDHGVDDSLNFDDSPLEGNIQHFWSPEQVSDPEFYIGSYHLFGESPRRLQRGFGLREVDNGKQEADLDYRTTITNLLG